MNEFTSTTDDVTQLTATQTATIQELKTKLMREYDTEVLREMVIECTINSMLRENVFRGLVGFTEAQANAYMQLRGK